MRAHAEKEEPGALVVDPRRGGLGLFCAKSLHKAGKYNMFSILIKEKLKL